MPKCYSCGKELNAETDYGRQDTCPGCNRSTRCCKNCIFYDISRYNECSEPVADRVVDKEKGNFCDHFKPGSPQSSDQNSKNAALAAAQALFKKK